MGRNGPGPGSGGGGGGGGTIYTESGLYIQSLDNLSMKATGRYHPFCCTYSRTTVKKCRGNPSRTPPPPHLFLDVLSFRATALCIYLDLTERYFSRHRHEVCAVICLSKCVDICLQSMGLKQY